MTLDADLDPELRRKRVRFRASHRGFREADIILGGFAEAEAERLSEEDLSAFERLLEQPDHSLYAWVIGREPAPLSFETPLLARIRAHLPKAHLSLGSKA